MRRALGILLLLLTWALVPPVQAQVLRCQSQHLGKQDRSRVLTTQTLQLLQDPTSAAPAHQCGAPAQPEKDAQDWEKLKTEYLLKPSDEVVTASVFHDESGTISIDLFEGPGPEVIFSADTVAIVDCWGEWVVIT